MKISVVIPAYNEEKYIGKTLESVKKLELGGHELEILVIDGDSSDRTAEIAKSYGARVKHEPHKGIGFARQHGIKHATGDIIAFTDADTIVPKDWLKKHVDALKKPGVVFSYGGFRLLNGNFPFYHFFNYIQPLLISAAFHLFHLPVASGQNMVFWKTRALSIGGFDEQLKVMEDTDLAIRISKIGRIRYLPNLIIYTSGRRSVESWKYFFRMSRSVVQYYLFGLRNLKKFPDYR